MFALPRHLSSTDASPAPEAVSSQDDFCGTTYAAKLLGLSVATVQALVEKGDMDAWKTRGGHRRISLKSIDRYRQRFNLPAPSIQYEARHRLRVMVVEDDEAARELYRANFEQWSLEMDLTLMESALEALLDVASLQPDLLITDLNMPGVDGVELLKVLQRNRQRLALQVVVVTGLPPAAIEARGGLPSDAVLVHKPLNFDWLHGYVSALLAAKRMVSQANLPTG